jgi:hypothetical protein
MEQSEFLRTAVQTLESLAIPYAIVGSWGSGVYGEARFTRDIDIVVDLPLADVPRFCAAFPASEFYLSEEAARSAIRDRSQFNLLHPASGNKIDFMLTRPNTWDDEQLRRRRRIEFPQGANSFHAYVAAPEGVILGKLWYYSQGGGERHLRDIDGILRVSGADVDRSEVERWAARIGCGEVWQLLVAESGGSDPSVTAKVPK